MCCISVPKKVQELTLLEKSGNDFDQCALLVALLQAAGYNNAAYQFGWMGVPYDGDFGRRQRLASMVEFRAFQHQTGIPLRIICPTIFYRRGYPLTFTNVDNYGTPVFCYCQEGVGDVEQNQFNQFIISTPVLQTDGSNHWHHFDQCAHGILSSNGILSPAAGSIDTGNYTSNLNEANIRSTLTGYTTNLLNYIQSNYPE